jgi:2-polyprenyl-3-methyl-5-hydroxy-6-metoxy-1,4-benzoquinol methylase/uncharacterized protein YbaR (Trm112 family)
MKRRLLEYLICPGCGGPGLELESALPLRDLWPPEIGAAILACELCGRSYPVVDGVPRLLPDSWEEHRERLAPGIARRAPAKGEGPAAARDAAEVEGFRARQGATRESFGFEWLRHQVTRFPENLEFFRRSLGIEPAELAGKLVLDAGCGMGRFLEVAASGGAEVVGLDLSRAVERAQRETRHRSRVHFVQGDIFRPPFARESFDVIYSIGVLHHTPDTRRAFEALVPLLKPGGRIAIWVYRTFQPEVPVGVHKRLFERLSEWTSDATRALTTRMPHELLHLLCYGAAPTGWLMRQVRRWRPTRYALAPLLLLPVSEHADWRVRVCDTFDWLSPKYQWKHTSREVREWFAAAGLTGVRSLELAVGVQGVMPDSRGRAADGGGTRERSAGEGRP